MEDGRRYYSAAHSYYRFGDGGSGLDGCRSVGGDRGVCRGRVMVEL